MKTHEFIECVSAFLAALAAARLQSPDQSMTRAENATQPNATQKDACLEAGTQEETHTLDIHLLLIQIQLVGIRPAQSSFFEGRNSVGGV